MPATDSLATLRTDLATEVTGHLLPYWMSRTVDETHGGFVGRINGDNEVVAEAPKAAVLNTRILWTFSAAARVLDHDQCQVFADRAYAYISEHFWDEVHEGIYWMVDHTGKPLKVRKQIYAQAFALYAFAEYHRATGHEGALDRAIQLFELLEGHSFDTERGGYYEAFSRDWTPLDVVRLSDRDPNEKKSMNTHLHVMEAYTSLYRVWGKDELAVQLRGLVEQFLDVIIDESTAHLILFFDETWERRSSSISFGHDIEASWLLHEAAEVLGLDDLHDETAETAVRMAHATLRDGIDDDHGLAFEAEPDGITNPDRHWWPQAEAVVGFLNAFQVAGEERFREAAVKTWAFIQKYLVDREHGEWKRRVSPSGEFYAGDDKVGPWKGPYHGVRACLEGVRRIGRLLAEADQWPEDGEREVEAAPESELEST
jgi:mannobiose 2-epimerase